MNKLSSLLHQATFAGFLLLICTMIYGFSDFQRMVLYFFFGCTALEFVIDQKWRNYRWTKEKTWYSLVLLFFLLLGSKKDKYDREFKRRMRRRRRQERLQIRIQRRSERNARKFANDIKRNKYKTNDGSNPDY